MPMYEYKCQTCGKTWVKMVSIADRDRMFCEECSGIMVRKLQIGTVYSATTGRKYS